MRRPTKREAPKKHGQAILPLRSTAGLLPVCILFLNAPASAQSEATPPAGENAALNSSSKSDETPKALQEVIVTATLRKERLIDTPQQVSAVTSADLQRLDAVTFTDFANTVPGLNFTTASPAETDISMRGITTGSSDVGPTVAIYLNDVPIGSNTTFGAGAFGAVDVATFDLNRIEVLPGPQGTLYGANAMGGVIKYVTNSPNVHDFGGSAQAGLSDTQDGGVNYNVDGAVNIPVIDGKAAVRASAYESHDGGYINNVALNEKDVNRSNTYGAKFDFLALPTEALTVRVTGFLQDIASKGEATVDYSQSGVPQYGALDQYRLFQEPIRNNFRLIAASLRYDFGPVNLTSISSYQSYSLKSFWDASVTYVPLLNSVLGPTYSAVGVPNADATDKSTQELRLASRSTGSIEWLLGGFYTHEDSSTDQQFALRDLAGNPAPNFLFTYLNPSIYKEYAAFGDLTAHLTSRFDVTGGLRVSHDEQYSAQTGSGAFIQSGNPHSSSSETVATYLGNLRYKINQRAMLYARYATGYRPGGPNYPIIDPTTGQPLLQAAFEPDHLRSYELGFKAETAQRRYGIDLSLYDMDWSNIQLTTIVQGFAAITNASGGATAQGAELTLTANPVDPLKLTATFAYQHSYMNQSEAALGATKGERLPNTPRFTGTITAQYRLPFEQQLQPTIGAVVTHVDNRTISFDGSASFPQYILPAYTLVDFEAQATFASTNLRLFVRNVTNERAQLGDLFPQISRRIAIAQPRTIGVMATWVF